MKAFALVLFCLFFITGCTKDEVKGKLCEAGKTAATVVATQLSVELSCSNMEAIKADMEEKLVKANICEKPEEGTVAIKSAVGDAICAPVIEGFFSGAVTQLPAEWGCTGGPLADEAKAKLIAACSKAF